MKKFVSTLLVFALMLVLSQSAFAATGFADTQETAFAITPTKGGVITITMSLSNSGDKDWYKWTNNTGKGRYISSAFASGGKGNSEFKIANKIVYNNGKETNLFYNEYFNGYSGVITDIYVPNGATIYVIIQSQKFDSPSDTYDLYFVDLDIR
ncbi:hypothetical protein QJQ58_08160 [Paenibacillus dendritiformis]|uniref:hypothetical protein n=1 Tax=Paenibacillus dendritiformis TaxID=130049 RepID=UPI00248ABEB8|nr:hypothetical protein [Paenibacillus dendritiformis]WGU96200.1 hypothetical protein QJQ58_08160 [Paenibacillus dendritiformis]